MKPIVPGSVVIGIWHPYPKRAKRYRVIALIDDDVVVVEDQRDLRETRDHRVVTLALLERAPKRANL